MYFQQRAIDEKDEVYGSDEYKSHYYKVKFGFEGNTTNSPSATPELLESYLQGLVWVLNYYHHGCASWTWYYPYLYAPLSTDLRDLSKMSIKFEQGTPFTPLLQLLSVLPPQSGKLLPLAYR